eukprot:6475119-Amphidinium_carterae.1
MIEREDDLPGKSHVMVTTRMTTWIRSSRQRVPTFSWCHRRHAGEHLCYLCMLCAGASQEVAVSEAQRASVASVWQRTRKRQRKVRLQQRRFERDGRRENAGKTTKDQLH